MANLIIYCDANRAGKTVMPLETGRSTALSNVLFHQVVQGDGVDAGLDAVGEESVALSDDGTRPAHVVDLLRVQSVHHLNKDEEYSDCTEIISDCRRLSKKGRPLKGSAAGNLMFRRLTSRCGSFLPCLYAGKYGRRNSPAGLGAGWREAVQIGSCQNKQGRWT